jgi:DNA-3-methyladenine glycosylase II
MPVGPDFISLQVRDLDTAAAFYEDRVGLRRAPASPPGAVVFASEPIPFAVREPLPDTDLDSGQPGLGIALWLKVDDGQALHDQLAGRGVTILTDPFDGPFGRTFALRDPDGYAVTIHDAAQMAITFHPLGQFSLTAAAAFAEDFPGTRAEGPPKALRYAWAVDGDWRTVQVTVRQDDEAIHAELGDQPPAELARQAARDLERMLSLDVDGTDFAALGERDDVVRALQRRFPGLRPVLFYTPYEAAAWAIIGQRIRMTQAATIKERLSDELGKSGAFPAPALLAQLSAPQPGLTDRKIGQLRALATAAEDGALTRERLRAMTHEDGLEHLQQLPGIGPFSAELILIRGAGNPDALPDHDTRLDDAIRSAYSTSDDSAIHQITESWRPYRAWVALLLRAWREAETGEIARGRRSTTRLQPPDAT